MTHSIRSLSLQYFQGYFYLVHPCIKIPSPLILSTTSIYLQSLSKNAIIRVNRLRNSEKYCNHKCILNVFFTCDNFLTHNFFQFVICRTPQSCMAHTSLFFFYSSFCYQVATTLNITVMVTSSILLVLKLKEPKIIYIYVIIIDAILSQISNSFSARACVLQRKQTI